MHLPSSQNLPIQKLASVFNSTSATYKYYWFLAIIELVESGTDKIEKKAIFTKMISNCWYPINYFHLSFGKQDNLQIAVETILKNEPLTIDENKNNIERCLSNTINKESLKQLFHFDKNVPHWFLSPWIPVKDKNSIYFYSQKFEGDCIYAVYKDVIVINPKWLDYLTLNARILKDFCYWNLSLFLQVRNPNVPDIPNKLVKPALRSSLTKQRNNFWKVVFDELGHVDCIFTGTRLYFTENNFAIDHFVPHAFVSHDLIWNLIPIEKRFNSSKSDRLPIFEKHFDKFLEIQKTAFELNKKYNPGSKYLEEYLSIFPDINTFEEAKFVNTIQPLLTIANNNGFLYLYD